MLSVAIASLVTNLSRARALGGGVGMVYFEPNDVSLGTIPLFVAAEFTIPIVNGGGETILLGEIKPSCGCTSVSFDQTSLGPGSRTVARGTIRPSVAGQMRVWLTVEYHCCDSMRRGPSIGAIVTAEAVATNQ
jgi:hypothetical protein